MNKIKHFFIVLFCILACVFDAKAKHIIGGEVTYVCNGNGTYTFTMFVYRDCRPGTGGAAFDNPAAITIYREGVNGYIYSPMLDFEINIAGDIENIPPDDLPCLEVPPGLCVEKATYIFTVGLSEIPESYHIVYQRCCRNETITNIANPGDSGATYTIELTPKAQEICNNSPVFNGFPPIVICVNEPLVFDHSASDTDGDQLVYEFCSPIMGGGLGGLPGGIGNADDCTGVQPNPACPPPFDEVFFQLPTYTELNPMAGNPVISINPNTGLITGTPQIEGQFVVGVCINEFRGGVLISETRRDFQFNVVACTATVDALIDYDELIGDDQYVINACGETDVSFTNLSVQQQFIDSYDWEFVVGVNDTLKSDIWEPTITFPGIGTYPGQLILNRGEGDCSDTADIFVNLYPAIEADFSFEYDTCVAGPVDFTDLSVADAGPGTITDWEWTFSDQGSSTDQNPSFQFMDPGDLPVSLTVTDINKCEDTETQIVEWYPAPALILIEPSIFDGCAPQEVFFNNLSFPIDSTYDIVWDFGDGTIGSDISPTHIYEEPGTYDISLEITSPIGCFVSESWEDWIIVRPSPIADFYYTPEEICAFEPTVDFIDQSSDAVAWYWDFDSDGSSMEINPSFTFPDTGLQEVTLLVTHQSGCQDSLTQILDVVPKVTYFLPNAFTPNHDDVNDFFRGNGILEGMKNFNLSIWNRWGEQLFETNDPTEGWNGRKNNTGKLSQNGVYVCIVTYTGPRGGNYEIKGFATLIK